MKKVLIAYLMAVVLVAPFCAGVVYAGTDLLGDTCTGNTAVSNSNVCREYNQTTNPLYGPNGVLMKVANILAVLVSIAAVVVIIVSGINYMTSQGDSSKVQSAKNAIIYAVIGIIIAAAARSIVSFIVRRL